MGHVNILRNQHHDHAGLCLADGQTVSLYPSETAGVTGKYAKFLGSETTRLFDVKFFMFQT